MKAHRAPLTISVAVLTLLATACGNPPVDVVAGSALMAAAVSDVSGGALTVRALIPAGMCPGHYDLRPSDVEAVARSRATLIHPWQRQMPNVRSAFDGAGVTDESVQIVGVDDNWMVPANYARALGEVASVLAKTLPRDGVDYVQRAADRAEEVTEYAQSLTDELEEIGAGTCRVLCSSQQAPFITWAGFDVIDVFGRAEDLSVADVQALVVKAKEAKAVLVIDNLQSGDTRTGEAMARDIGCAHVTLSNFPGAFDDTETWEKAVARNVALLRDAMTEQTKRHG